MAKSVSRRRRVASATSTHNDPFPPALLAALCKLTVDTLPESDGGREPLPKRPRVDAVESIPVLREAFTISRPTGDCSPKVGRITFNDAGRYFTFHFYEGQFGNEDRLILRTKASAPLDALECVLYIKEGIRDTTRAALAVLGGSREDSAQEGALTVLTTISLDADDTMHHIHFTLDVNFNASSYTCRNARERSLSQHVLDVLPNQAPASDNAPILPNTFYGVAFMPPCDSFNDLEDVPIRGLETTLYPFQRQTSQWLLEREQVKYSGIGPDGTLQLTPYSPPPNSAPPFSFRATNDANGQQYYVSDLCHVVARDVSPFREIENVRGGILAEEMGLGKTVEIITLILTHPRGPYPATELDARTNTVVHPTGATLIVTPDTLQNQWISEFKKHAPELLVMKYPGIKALANNKTLGTEQEGQSPLDRFICELADYDVVITTYSVLQAELHYASAPPDRSMRYERKHERHISPLVKIGWWRVCLDEAQEIDSGVNSAAQVACLIPRVNAWAVTGTPVKDDPNDLWGLLLFLGYEPFASNKVVWKALLSTHTALFGELFKRIALRHSKRAIRDELRLPSQKRYLVTIPFTAIEEHHYQSQFRALLAKAGLDEQGAPLRPDWDPDNPLVVEFMKKALASLRQTILHPELGANERARVVIYKTLAEHLETMIEHSETNIKTHRRNYLIAKLSRGQLLENSPRVGEALKIWEEVLGEVAPDVREAREELQKALESAQQEQSKATDSSGNQDIADEEPLETAKVGECRRKLRMFLDLQHRATFFIASAFFQIKTNERLTKPGSDEFRRLEGCEAEGYEVAQKIRRELLQEPLTKVSKLIKKLQERVDTQSFVEIPEIATPDVHGIESWQIAADLETLSASLNEQAGVIHKLREHVIRLLLKPLVDADDEEEITGEEYEDSTKVQDHLMVYTLILGAVIGDRSEALTGLPNERIRYETATAEGMAKRGEGHAPEKLLELLELRTTFAPQPVGTSLRSIIGQLRERSTTLRQNASRGSGRAGVELQIVSTQLRATQIVFTKHNKVTVSLEKELEFFTSAMNTRVEFYRQLQSVSDNVAPLPYEITATPHTSWDNYLAQESEMKKKTKDWGSNRRHLIYLREESSNPTEPCAICRSEGFSIAAITTCGHKFCRQCILQWLRSKHRCPLCQTFQVPTMLKEFHTHQAVAKQPSLGSRLQVGPGREWGVYSKVHEDKKRAIQDIKLHGRSYSSKVDTLIKHLIWLQEQDPGAKSVIFTQFRTFFRILEQALTEHRIGFATFTRAGDKSLGIQAFKDDPSVECLLMDAKAHSSGLNLVNASHVFLCEPLLNTALELQAIARVDRIGQEHETTVWLYVVEGTVEENIHDLSERRRLAHIEEDKQRGKGKATVDEGLTDLTLEEANSRELEQSHLGRLMDKSEDGEIVDQGDLWECLFGRAVEA